ncbi:MAG: helix-turn-helix transcriptional regulator [Acidimicrobiia bacterium]|jgi:transcriptional regulator with XRE-family HTH domain
MTTTARSAARSTRGSASRAGWVLVEARRRADLTQAELAALISVPQSTISAYERGVREPTMPTLERMLRGAGFRVELELVPMGIDTERNGRVLRDLLGLVEVIPAGPKRGALSFPRIPSSARP